MTHTLPTNTTRNKLSKHQKKEEEEKRTGGRDGEGEKEGGEIIK
jgi:hypothetical protein